MKTSNKIFKVKKLIFLLLLFSNSACEDFLQIDPPKTEIVSAEVFENDAAAIAAVRGIYSLMVTNSSFTNAEFERYTGLSANEFSNHSSQFDQQQFALASLEYDNQIIFSMFWKEAYLYIHNANALLEGIKNSASLSPTIKLQLEGEAKFIRAFCHLQLMNLFGEIPYVTSIDYRVTGKQPRQPVDVVFENIIADLKMAQQLLPSTYMHALGQRIQPNQGAATALLSRVYLYQEKWELAETEATKVIDDALYGLTTLDKVFLANSAETILQLKPVVPGTNTRQATLFFLSRAPASSIGRVALNPAILDAFETDDQRSQQWIGEFVDGTSTYYFPVKYKAVNQEIQSEYSTILRLAEQYLIRAESRAQQDKITLAVEDVDIIRTRAGLTPIATSNPAITQEELLIVIERERQVELFSEGHRWLDLIRTNRADQILGPLKLDWQTTDQLYPIPQAEILLNPALTQNPGY